MSVKTRHLTEEKATHLDITAKEEVNSSSFIVFKCLKHEAMAVWFMHLLSRYCRKGLKLYSVSYTSSKLDDFTVLRLKIQLAFRCSR